MGCIRSRFLRAVVETVHQETAGTALPRLREGLQPHLRGLLQREVLGAPDAAAAARAEQVDQAVAVVEDLVGLGGGHFRAGIQGAGGPASPDGELTPSPAAGSRVRSGCGMSGC